MKYTNYQLLCNSIIRQAAEDYQEELNLLKIDPDLRSCKHRLLELDNFFTGSQIEVYTELSGTYLRDGVKAMNEEEDVKVDYKILLEYCHRLRLEQPVGYPTEYSQGYREAVRRMERALRRLKNGSKQRATGSPKGNRE